MPADRPIPFPSPLTREESSSAAEALARDFRADLFAARLEDEEPDYELLERYTDGTLSEEEADALALRAEWDPALARELADLAELGARLNAGRRSAAAPAAARRARLLRVAGLAAALLLAILGLDRSLEQRSPQLRGQNVAHSAPPNPTQPVFRDGFESGSASSWAN